MKFRQRVHFFTIAAVMAGVLITSGCGKKNEAASKMQMPAPEVGVLTVKPERVTLTSELPGRTSAYLIAEVRPQVGGIILKRLFTEGSDVKAGDVLYQIDPSVYQAAYASAKAALGKAEANVVPLRLKKERYGQLVAIDAVSKQDSDEVSAQLEQAEAEIAAAKAALETARINLAYTKVTAPISGRIGRSSVTTGALVTASQAAPLATIQELDEVYVDVTQSSAELLKLKQDMACGLMRSNGSAMVCDPAKIGGTTQARVKLLLEDGSPYPLPGTLKFSEVTVDQGTGSITLRAVFPNPRQTLLPGMFVRAIVEKGVNDQAILVPQRGVTRTPQGEAMVMVVGAGDTAEPRPIKVSQTVGDSWLVSEGLKTGDRVILEGIQKARPGTPVKAVPFGSTANATPAAATQPPAAKK